MSVPTPRKNRENPKSVSHVSKSAVRLCASCPASPWAHGIDDGCRPARQTQNEIPAGLVPFPVRSSHGPSILFIEGNARSGLPTRLVDFPTLSPHRQVFLPAATVDTGHNRFQPHGLGSSLPTAQAPRAMVSTGASAPHKSPGTASHHQSVPCLSSPNMEPSSAVGDGQHHHTLLRQQAKRHTLPLSPLPSCRPLGVVLFQPCLSHYRPHLHVRQHLSGPPQSAPNTDTRMGSEQCHIPTAVPQMGHPFTGPFCFRNQQKMSPILLQSRKRNCLSRGCVPHGLVPRSSVCIPPASPHSEGHSLPPARRSQRNIDRPVLASPAMVHSPGHDVVGHVPSSSPSRSSLARPRPRPSPRCRLSQSFSLEDTPEVMQVLLRARKPSTTLLYENKWKSFLKYTHDNSLPAVPVSLKTVLTYLLHLFEFGLSQSTMRVYLSAIMAHQPDDSPSSKLFSHPTVKKFLKGLNNMCPLQQRITPQWSLQLVLNTLIRHPFEPMACIEFKFLILKTAFLVAITSAKRASELAALQADPPFIQFHSDKVTLYFDVSFLPKVVSDFHLNQPIILLCFFKSPSSPLEHMLHTLDVRHALAFYVERTKSIRKSSKLFLCFHGPNKGHPASSQSIARWIVQSISLAYSLSEKTPPQHLTAHSARALSTSTAFHCGTEVPDICHAATWSTPATFVKHYWLDVRACQDAAFGRDVLSSFLP
ncbi:12S rRNA N(4)-cytidine methyltransferase METTL15 isoform X1 [Pogona vitticeps]